MESNKRIWFGALALAGLIGTAQAQHKIVAIDGSSTVYPITEAVAEEYQKLKKGTVKVTVGISGTGGGFKKFCRGETDISDASRPILKQEMEACRQTGIEYIELPVAYDALTVVINPKNDWAEEMTVAELKKMWEPAAQGVVDNWKKVSERFPDRPLKLAVPAPIPARSTTSPKPSSANRSRAAAITWPPKTTT